MSEALEDTEVVDVLALLPNEGGDELNEEAEEELSDEIPEDVEELKAMLLREREIKTKRNKSLKNSKKATHRIQEENDLLKQRLDALETKLTGSQPNVEVEKLELEAQEWRDRVADDPTQALGYADWKNKHLEDRVANYLGEKMQEFESQLGALKGAVDPEKAKYRETIDTLRTKEGFSELDDDVLLAVAKGFDGAKSVPRGGIGGHKPTQQPQEKKFVLTPEQRDAMGF
jgi:predicted  nucleic acid-binding Zn-ribbon protein